MSRDAKGSDKSARPTRPIKPYGSILRHKVLFLFTFLLIAPLGIPMMLIKGPVYEATAMIKVEPLQQGIVEESKSIFGYREFIADQALILTSPDTLRRALINLGVPEEDPKLPEQVAALQKAVSANQVKGTYSVVISMKSKKPEGLARTVNAVVNAYMEYVNASSSNRDEDRKVYLLRERQKLQRRLDTELLRRSEVMKKLGFLGLDQEMGAVAYDDLLESATNRVNESRTGLIRAKAEVDAFTTRMREQGQQYIEQRVIELLDNDQYLEGLRAQLNAKRNDVMIRMRQRPQSVESATLRTSDMEQEDARQQQLQEQQAAAYQQERRSLRVSLMQLEKNLAQERQRIALKYIRRVQAELRQEESKLVGDYIAAQEREQTAKAELETLRSQGAEQIRLYQDAAELNRDIERTREQVAVIQQRIDSLEQEKNAPGNISLASEATPPVRPVSRGISYVVGFIAMGLLLACGVPTVVDYFDPRVLSPLDIISTVGFPPMTWILERTDERAEAFAQDQIRRLALSLYKQHKEENCTKFVLTSVKSSGGTTRLALDLALELGRIGVPALAIEANAFQPSPLYQATADNFGFIGLLSNMVAPEEIVLKGSIDLPDRIPVGPVRKEYPHLNFSPQALDSLDELKEHYKVFLFDAPPVLLSGDTEVLCNYCDATMLIVPALRTIQGELARAVGHLDKIGVAKVGLVLNRLPVDRRSGYFNEMLNEYESRGMSRRGNFMTRWLWSGKI